MRKLRSLTSLRAFEAVARHGSVSVAAAELLVTRPAISKQVALLERDLACQLLHRDGNRISLTSAGEELQAGLRQAFDLISTSVEGLKRRMPKGERVRVLVCRDFASGWLAGQVGTFLVGNPGISVEITAERNGSYRLGEDFDFRIFYGPEHPIVPPGLSQSELCRWIDMPVCAPKFAEQYLRSGKSLAEAPQLVDANYDIWEDWCAYAGLQAGLSRQRTLFNETNLCMSAAAAGSGMAIGDSFLNMPMIRQGMLMIPFKTGLLSAEVYSLYVPLLPEQTKVARRFEDWLRTAVQTYQSTILDELCTLGIKVVGRS
jgi:LysR family glycine cleavage system transcriptional activator/LysR family transcriptional regulator of beta-lactamase